MLNYLGRKPKCLTSKIDYINSLTIFYSLGEVCTKIETLVQVS